jgi:hypothetical protein
MNYQEAFDYREINKHLVEHYIVANTENGLESFAIIIPLLIAPETHISEMHAESTKTNFDNKQSLIDLGLIDMDLKVFVVSVISETKLYYQDLYKYLQPIRDANLN